MKKYGFILFLLTFSLVLSACAGTNAVRSEPVSSLNTVTSVTSRPESSSQAVSSSVTSSKYTVSVLSTGTVLYIYPNGDVRYLPRIMSEDDPDYWDPGYGFFYDVYADTPVNPDLSCLSNEVICQLAATGSRTYLLTESGRIFACGDSEYCSLAQAGPEPVQGVIEIDLGEKVKFISAGENCACAVGESNTLYVWGWWIEMERRYGQIANADDGFDGYLPLSIPFDQPIKEVSLEANRVLILTEKGEVYSVGDTYQQFYAVDFSETFDGFEWSEEKFLIPQKIEIPEKIVQVIATRVDAFMLGESGTCYAIYDARVIRFPSETSSFNPHLKVLDFSQPIVQIGVGDSSLFALTKAGEVYAAGCNVREHLGIGAKKDSDNIDTSFPDSYNWMLKRFEKVDLPEKIKQLGKCADINGLFLGESGAVYATGCNYRDWLLTDRPIPSAEDWYEEYLNTPTRIQLPNSIDVCNLSGSAFFYRDTSGTVWFAGTATYGNGLSVDLPCPIDGIYVQREPVEVPLHFSEDCRFN